MMLINNKMFFLSSICLLSAFAVTACSSSSHQKTNRSNRPDVIRVSSGGSGSDVARPVNNPVNSQDSWQGFNRRVFNFNSGLDKAIVKPLAKAYKKVTPVFVDQSVSNFFANLEDVGNAFNNLLQFKPKAAVNDTARFVFNSTFGLAGFLDVATEMELEKHDEDFGQTLARWGVGSGPYLVLPVFGPSTLRDASARFTMDIVTDPIVYSDAKVEAFAVKYIDKRAGLLATEEAFKDISVDQYSAVRDAWLQRRDYLIRDGKTNEKQQSDMINELESLDAE